MALLASTPGTGAIATAAATSLGAPKSSLGVPRSSCSSRSLGLKTLVAAMQQGSGSTTVVTSGQSSSSGVTEVDKDSFWPLVDGAGDKVVVLDMYTQWCGPCKMMFPKIVELSSRYSDVMFLKLDCNQENKPLAKELGIRVVPTFKILKHKKIVAEIAGAKFDDLVRTIDTVRTG
ncbi:hypothetical protein SELMODRAFT_183993 [Selaginella moellendorffii]|uniref:Thioredoxin domain-containing protein n=1 Tax=Selaginella moellendorffii TaxID=88036 RepID=D8SZ34_SELML|nr:thioredoxin F2, chloroplastic [Selaginella moellendorffii]XP_024518183.1 thioredoxin F2, chloroplastic [Selaginella moellendorffii]XP_024518184.1 thioredoxin F2, chloroplastic [Selaginella moellendorffii]EFJ10424.1 hypothetical protein SELMODRAFT_183993 [Selaginella moellendorffii]|eukprot:XP_002988628.1 thioredoxin F2, chloroplastic [Selaginella moellendorffii]